MRLWLITDPLARWVRALAAMAWVLWLAMPSSAVAQAGPSWRSIGPAGGTVLSLVASPLAPAVLYAGTSRNGVFVSADAGQTWSAANTGLTATANSAWRTVRALAVDTQYVYAATDVGLFYAAAAMTVNDLPNWAPVTGPSGLAAALSLLAVDTASNMLLAATTVPDPSAAPAIYTMPLPAPGAAPSGSWVASPMPPATVGSAVGAMTVFPGVAVFAGVGAQVFFGSIVGAQNPMSWQDADPQLVLRQLGLGAVEAVHYSSDFGQVYACSGGQLLYATSAFDPLNSWNTLTVTPAPTMPFSCTGMASGSFGGAPALAVATSAGVYLSTDGMSFAPSQSLGVSPAANVVSMVGGATPTLFVGAGFGVASQPLSTLAPGAAWSADNGPTTVGNTRLNNANATDIAVMGTTSLYAAVAAEQYADVLASTDAGATWTSTGLKSAIPSLFDVPAIALDAANRVVYAGTDMGLYALAAGSWVQIGATSIALVNSLAVVGGTLFVGTDDGLYALALRATPSSSTVTPAGLTGLRVSALHAAGGNLYAGVFDFNAGLASVSVASSATSNPTWADFATGAVGTHRIFSLLWTGSTLLAASRGELVSVALPGGSWAAASNGLSDPNGVATSLSSDGSVLYVATGSNGVFTSPLGASAWSPYSGSGTEALPSLEVHSLLFDSGALYAATAGGVAAVGAITSGPPPPPPGGGGGAGGGGGGGGAIDIVSLLALLVITVAAAATRRGRHRAQR